MKRAVVLAALFLGSCVGDDGTGITPDALPEDGDDFGSGSGSGSGNFLFGMDPSPPDVTLEWMVIGLSVIVVGGSVRSRRRSTKTYQQL